MSQVNFNLMVSVDWLQLSLRSFSLLSTPADCDTFFFRQRSYGTKQFRNVYDVDVLVDGDVLEPFGVFCSVPTLDSWDAQMCSLKLDNHLLYSNNRGSWIDHLQLFLSTYQLAINSISRVDLAGDFIYLRNRVSGPSLCSKIKNLSWWKCGSVNIAEHYKMPYSLEWSRSIDKEGIDTQIYLQGNKMTPRVETLTFGTMSSDAQVCIYDKTLELNRTAINVTKDGQQVKESAKEYIRDCHKLAGVYDPNKHTWRIEIRLKNKAAFLWDEYRSMERQLYIEDLSSAHVVETYLAACDKYFRLVDATCDNTIEVSPEYCRKMRGHKNRLPKVHLFSPALCRSQFVKKEYHKPANQFHRSVINRLEQLADRTQRIPCKETIKGDDKLIPNLIERLHPLSSLMKNDKKRLLKAINTLTEVQQSVLMRDTPIDNVTATLITQTKEMLERHFNTESPVFVNNMISTLNKCASGMTNLLSKGATRPAHAVRSAHPSDSEVLAEAANVLRGVFANVVHDERKQQQRDLYTVKLIDCINHINAFDLPNPQVLDYTYKCFASNRMVQQDVLDTLLAKQVYSPFGMLVQCNFNIDLWLQKRGLKRYSIEWVPPLLPIGEYRQGYSPRDRIISLTEHLQHNNNINQLTFDLYG